MRASLSVLTSSLVLGLMMPLTALADDATALPAPVDAATDHIRGNVNAPATLIVYTDFQCPFCRRHHPVMQKILADYADKVRLVYRNYPLSSIHPAALPAALAAECVASLKDNDTYWKFVDKLFATDDMMTFPIRGTAIALGIDGTAFDACVAKQSTTDRVNRDIADGTAAGVLGTPSTFIVTAAGSQMISGAYPYEQFSAALNALNLKAADKPVTGASRIQTSKRTAHVRKLAPGLRFHRR